jgi:hypothetical protein
MAPILQLGTIGRSVIVGMFHGERLVTSVCKEVLLKELAVMHC